MAGSTAFAPRQRLALAAWAILIGIVYALIGAEAVSTIRGEKLTAERNHLIRLTAGQVEPGQTPPDPLPANADFIPVHVGIYLDGIENMSIRDSFWMPTFYIWFRWSGHRDLAPGANFKLVDARMDRKDLMEEFFDSDGTNYQRYRVTARVTKFFNTTRVPRDGHMLNIYVEDNRSDVSRLRYVADPTTSLSSRVKVSGYELLSFGQIAKTHTYRTNYGDPHAVGDHGKTFSMYTFAVTIQRTGFGVYLKIFLGLFAGIALALTSFALRAADAGPRFSMLAGAYFGAVANSYLASSLLPSTGQFGLIEHVTLLGMFTIFFSLLATIFSIYVWNVLANKELSQAFDRVTVATVGLSYVLLNLILPMCA